MAARTAWRICSNNGWRSAFAKPKQGKGVKHPGPPAHDDQCASTDEHGVTRHRFSADASCIVHSDGGSQFRSRKFVHAINRQHLVGSMGRVGAAGDNAAMKSFFALRQNNVLDRQHWATREELRFAIVTWIERTYHRRRRQAGPGRLTPIEYETTMTQQDTTPATQAA